MSASFFLLSFVISVIATMLVVKSAAVHGAFTADHDFDGPQKVHVRAVPRIGGVAIAIALIASSLLLAHYDVAQRPLVWLLLLCALPTFGAGLVEDLTKRVRPRTRLLFTAVSATLAVWLVDSVVRRSGIAPLDELLQIGPLAAAFTVFMMVGIANAVNIIDGFNGLASMCMMLIFGAMAYVAFQVGDTLLCSFALIIVSALFGFFVWNFPRGLIFLGDGGAYLIGFLLGQMSVLLVQRNPAVSPWFPILLCAYPIFETLFSIYRRRVLRGTSPGDADGMHLHSLVYKRLMRWSPLTAACESTARNSLTSPYLWVLCLLTVMPAVAFWYSTTWLILWVLGFVGLYLVLYWRIVRFRTPRWLVVRR